MTSPLPLAQRRRRLLVIAASATAHAAVLAILAFGASGGRLTSPEAAPPMVYLDIAPRPLLSGETPRPARPPVAVETDEARPARARPSPFDLRRRNDEEESHAPTPRPAAPGAAAAAAEQGVDGAWRYRPETAREGVGRALRVGPIGCNSHYDRLTPAEQALCDERFNERAAAARPITGAGDPARDARMAAEGDRALARYEGRRAPLAGGTGVVGPADCPGSNLGTGCAGAHLPDVPNVDMRQGARTTHTPSQKR